MEYTGGDMPRIVQILDTFTELELLDDYLDWAKEGHRVAYVDDEMESARFFETWRHELHQDLREVEMEDAEDLKHQPMEVDISQWPESDVRDSVNRPIILRWNYEFKINPDGTWVLVDPLDAMLPPCSPVESVKDEEETEGEATFFTASTVESKGENVQQQKAGSERYEEPNASSYDTNSNALSGPEHSITRPSVVLPSRTVSSIAAFNTMSQRSTTLGLSLELHPNQADKPFSSDLALRLIGLPQARHGDDLD